MTLRLRLASSASSRRSSVCRWSWAATAEVVEVVCCMSTSMSAQVVMGGASPARPAGAGLAAMSFTAWAVRPSCGVLQNLDSDGVVLKTLVDVTELGGDGVVGGGGGGGGGEEGGGGGGDGGGGDGEEGELGSQRAAHDRHICCDGGHVLLEGLLEE
eukprot:jgi/Mesvir1/1218/Mv17704-RA.1